MPQVLRCREKFHEESIKKIGNILFVFDGDSIYARCTDRGCKRWTKITLNIPGVKLDFSKVGFVQEAMPKGFRFELKDGDIERAPTMIKG